jgi:dethiobiotin synthetase
VACTIVLTGTGTGIGKTHVGERLLRALAARGLRSAAYKPLESGCLPGDPRADSARLSRAATFHVQPPPLAYVFAEPIAPHLAARAGNVDIDSPHILREIVRVAAAVDVALLELPGGALSPFDALRSCAEFARSIASARVLLVAPDRLGVIHDVTATTLACASLGLPIFGIVLNAPDVPDASTGRNAPEIARATRVPILASLSRSPADAPLTEGDPASLLAARVVA